MVFRLRHGVGTQELKAQSLVLLQILSDTLGGFFTAAFATFTLVCECTRVVGEPDHLLCRVSRLPAMSVGRKL